VEVLEGRLTPATHTWTGASGIDLNWSDPGNWNGGAPFLGEPNVVLDFGPVANNLKATVDDLGTDVGPGNLVIDQINVTDAGYSFSAFAGARGADTITLNGGSASPTVSDTVGGNTFDTSLTIALGGSSSTVVQLQAGTDTVNSTVTGAQGLTLSGAGTLVLTGPNTYSGDTHVNGGELNVQNNTALGTGSATVATGAALDLQAPQSPQGPGGQPGPSFLTLANNLTLNGPGVGGTGALRSISGVNTLTGNITLQTDSTIGVDQGSSVQVGRASSGPFPGSGGTITGAGGLTKAGLGNLILSGSTANSYGGPTAVNAGFVVLAKDSGAVAVPTDLTIGTGASTGSSTISSGPTVLLQQGEQIADNARVTINSDGLLNINLASETIGSLTGSGLVQFGSSSGSSTSSFSGPTSGELRVGADNTSTVFAGTIAGSAGNFVKIGSGTLALSGTSSFAGTTTVNGGILQVDGSLAGSSTVVNGGGALGGHGTVGPITANGGGTVTPGDSPGILTVHGGATFNPGSVLLIQVHGVSPGSGYGQLNVLGPVILGGPTLRLAFGTLPPRGVDLVIIANNGSGPVSGTFAGLPEDALLRHGSSFFDLSYVGGRGSDVDLLIQSRDDVFVRGLFADFNAQSTRATRAPFETRAGSGESRLSVARDFLSSPARRMGEVNQFYAAFGQPDDGLKGRYVAQLLAGVPAGQVLINFLTSASFRRHHRGSAAFVRALFTGLLGHPPGRHDQLGNHPPGFYVQELSAGAVSRAKLVQELLSSDDVYRAAIVQNFTSFLGMKPTPAQVQTLTGQLPSGVLNPDALTESIVALDSYIDFFIARAAAGSAPGVVLVNV
jgi:autotransporter-associated beta strand protein